MDDAHRLADAHGYHTETDQDARRRGEDKQGGASL